MCGREKLPGQVIREGFLVEVVFEVNNTELGEESTQEKVFECEGKS